MKRTRVVALILSFALMFSACEKQSSEEKGGSTPSDSSTETSEESNDKPTKQVSMNIDDLVSEMEETKGKNYHYPVLNETQLGERAKKFNQTMKERLKEATQFDLNEVEPEVGEPAQYFPYIDSERQIFSILFRYIELRGYYAYDTAVFDLNDPAREISATEALKMFDWEPNQLRERVEQYFKNIYAFDVRSFSGFDEPETDVEPMSYEDFIKDRMSDYDSEVKDGLPFTIDKEGLTVYFTTAYPTFMESHTERYRVKKNVIDDLFANETFGATMAIVNNITKEERKKLKIVDEYRQGEDSSLEQEKVFVALEDNVDFYLMKLEFNAEANTVVPTDTVYRRTLKKGEAVSIRTVLPEGMPNLRAVGEIREPEQEASFSFFYPFSYDGMLGDVKIEFIIGALANG